MVFLNMLGSKGVGGGGSLSNTSDILIIVYDYSTVHTLLAGHALWTYNCFGYDAIKCKYFID